ncbi:MAG: hypothetical protein ACREPQ_10720 [Rhodanobacter sp.]
MPSRWPVIVRLGSTLDPPNFDMRGLVHRVNRRGGYIALMD